MDGWMDGTVTEGGALDSGGMEMGTREMGWKRETLFDWVPACKSKPLPAGLLRCPPPTGRALANPSLSVGRVAPLRCRLSCPVQRVAGSPVAFNGRASPFAAAMAWAGRFAGRARCCLIHKGSQEGGTAGRLGSAGARAGDGGAATAQARRAPLRGG